LIFKDINGLFFDLDGTLIDSSEDLANSLNHALMITQKRSFDLDTIQKWIGNGAKTLVHRALINDFDTTKEIDEKLLSDTLEIFLKHYQDNLCIQTKLYPNVKETLKHFYQSSYRLAIITNKPYQFVEPILRELNIEKYFSMIIGGDTLKMKKPHPLPLLHTLEKLQLNKDQAIMIGDSKSDIIAANEANMHSIGVNYGYTQNEDLRDFNPSAIVEDFIELKELIRRDS